MRRCLVWMAVAILISSEATASADTIAFNEVRLAVTFLHQSSILAINRSNNVAVGAIAREEATTQPSVLAVLDHFVLSGEPQIATLSGTDIQTGRSAASGRTGRGDSSANPADVGATVPAAAIAIKRMAASQGSTFDRLFADMQLSVLQDLLSTYRAYGETGDDVALRRLAKEEASKTQERISALSSVAERIGAQP